MDVYDLIALFVLVASLVVHEYSHGWAARRLGDDTAERMGRLSFNPMVHLDPFGSVLVPVMGMLMGGFIFGWAKPVPVNPMNFRQPLRDHAYVAAAGPLSNLLLALACALVYGLVQAFGYHNPELLTRGSALAFLLALCHIGVILNVLLALFNMIPIPPLDGSWIMMTFLRGESARFYHQIRPYGFLIIVVLMMSVLRGPFQWAMGLVSNLYFNFGTQVSKIFI